MHYSWPFSFLRRIWWLKTKLTCVCCFQHWKDSLNVAENAKNSTLQVARIWWQKTSHKCVVSKTGKLILGVAESTEYSTDQVSTGWFHNIRQIWLLLRLIWRAFCSLLSNYLTQLMMKWEKILGGKLSDIVKSNFTKPVIGSCYTTTYRYAMKGTSSPSMEVWCHSA